MQKQCQCCKNYFKKKLSHSLKYWQVAKYCSYICSRKSLPLPRKRNPNLAERIGDRVEMVILKKNEWYKITLDHSDYLNPKISQFAWHLSSTGYPTRRLLINGKYKTKPMHSFFLEKKEGFVVDHIDRNPLNNCRDNLRYLTHQNNLRNSNTRSKTGVTGGTFSRNGKIRVSIKVNPSLFITVGTYSSVTEAKEARTAAEIKYWGHSYH